MEIQNTNVTALIDTGAAISCISPAVYLSSGLQHDFPLQKSDLAQVNGVGNNNIKVVGKISIPIIIAEVEITHTFFVLEGMTIPLILGMDFITQHRVILDFIRKELLLYDGLSKVSFSDVEQGIRMNILKTATTIDLNPRSETVFSLGVEDRDNTEWGLLEPDSSFVDTWNVLPARVLTHIFQNQVVCRVMNPTNMTVTLPASTIVGHLVQVEEVFPQPQQPEITVATVHTTTKEFTSADETKLLQLGIDVSQSHVTPEQRQKLSSFLASHRDIFAADMSELGHTHLQQMQIDTGDHSPIKQHAYRVSPHMKKEIDRQIQDMLQHGIITPSISPYASPVVMVKKKSGEYRFAVDYRKLNSITKVMNYPLPQFEDVTDILGKATIFSVMDLMSGFWQIPVHENSKEKTAFICHSGLYQFERVPFGLRNSPTVFQNVMEAALRGLNHKTALVYVDDIVAFSPDFDTHLQHLTDIFDHLKAAGLRLKPSKCRFAVTEVVYLGHVISAEGVKADPQKVQLVRDFPVPKNQHEVRSFLGLANYYRKFVKGFSGIAAPLNLLLQKDVKFQWTDDCQESFNSLKEALTSPPVLAYPNFDREFILYTDASATAISYILGQKDEHGRERVISYNGRSLRATEKQWGISERETLALVEGIKTFRVYLANKKFLVKTDHSAIQFLKKTKDPTGRLGRWAIFLQAYDFDVEHKPGRIHGNADSLSRRPYSSITPEAEEEVGEIPQMFPPTASVVHDHENSAWATERAYTISTIEPETIAQIQREDSQLLQMIQYLENGTLPDNSKTARKLVSESHDHVLDQRVLYHMWYPRTTGHKSDRIAKQLVVPHSLRNEVLLSFHDSLLAGAHQGVERTYHSIRLRYYWPGMYADITQYVKSCIQCQQSKRSYHANTPPLCPLPVPQLFERLHIDFLGPLEKSPEGYQYILLIVDAYSKWPEAFPLVTSEATEVAHVLYREIFCRYGAPDTLLSDRGQNFLSKLITELCAIFQVTRLKTSSYHAQTNAQCERFNSYLAAALRCHCADNTKQWPKVLPSVLSAYRVTPCSQSTQYSPYFLLFKKECRLPLDVALIPPSNIPTSASQCMDDILSGFELTQQIVKENTLKAQTKYKTQYDKTASNYTFVVGQKVWVYFPKLKQGVSAKLQRRWQGPYYICSALAGNVFLLRKSSDNQQLRSPIHAMRLKPYFDPNERPTNFIPEIDNDQSSDTDEESKDHSGADEVHVSSDKQTRTGTQTLDSSDDAHTKTQLLDDASSEEIYYVEKIVRCRRNAQGSKEYLIKWQGYSETTWEPAENLPDYLIEAFHINKTNKGCRRKNRPTT